MWFFNLHGVTNGHIMPRAKGSFTNSFSCNLNVVNLNIICNHGGIFTWRESLGHSIELRRDLSLRLIAKRFQRLFHVQFPSCWRWSGVILFEKLAPKIEVEFQKHLLHTMILGVGILCKACKVFVGVLIEKWEFILA